MYMKVTSFNYWLGGRVLQLNMWFPFIAWVDHIVSDLEYVGTPFFFCVWDNWCFESVAISYMCFFFLLINLLCSVEPFAWPFNLSMWGIFCDSNYEYGGSIVDTRYPWGMTTWSLKLTSFFIWFLLVHNHGVLCRYILCIRLLLSQICKLHISKSSTSSIHLQDSRIPLTFWR